MTNDEIKELTPDTELYFRKGRLYDGFVTYFGNPVRFFKRLRDNDQFGRPLIVVIDKANKEQTLSSGYLQLTRE